MRLPDFLGIGTQKGGTTYLHALLQHHPQIFLATPKEQHFFTLHWKRVGHWYADQFAQAESHQCCGEVTPYYLFHPEVPQRIKSQLPDVKLIVLLRDPVERALSQYFHSRRLGLEPLELEAAFAAEPQRLADAAEQLAAGKPHRSHQQHSYLSRSRYEQQLARFQELFQPEQLLILRSEQLFANPTNGWILVLQFLGVDVIPCPMLDPVYTGAGEAANIAAELKESLREQLQPTYRWMSEAFA